MDGEALENLKFDLFNPVKVMMHPKIVIVGSLRPSSGTQLDHHPYPFGISY